MTELDSGSMQTIPWEEIGPGSHPARTIRTHSNILSQSRCLTETVRKHVSFEVGDRLQRIDRCLTLAGRSR